MAAAVDAPRSDPGDWSRVTFHRHDAVADGKLLDGDRSSGGRDARAGSETRHIRCANDR
jgi:hypothetical protein